MKKETLKELKKRVEATLENFGVHVGHKKERLIEAIVKNLNLVEFDVDIDDDGEVYAFPSVLRKRFDNFFENIHDAVGTSKFDALCSEFESDFRKYNLSRQESKISLFYIQEKKI